MDPTKERLERLFAGGLPSAEPLLRFPIPLVRAVLAECAAVTLRSLGLPDDGPGDDKLEGLLEFERRCIKPYRGYTAEQALLFAVRKPEFQALSPEGRSALVARLMAVIEEATRRPQCS